VSAGDYSGYSVSGAGGADVLKGAVGDDVLVFDSADRLVDGGSGEDTLQFVSTGQLLDFTAIANNRHTGIETIDLTGTGNNSLTLATLDLLDLSDSTNTLRVDGNTGDSVNAMGVWTDGGVAGGYHTYTQGAATLLVDVDVTAVFS